MPALFRSSFWLAAGLFVLALAGGEANASQIVSPRGTCLEVVGAVNANGTPVQLHKCEPGNDNQNWTFNPATGQIVWAYGGKCLDVSRGSRENAAVVQIWQCIPNAAPQKFEYRAPAILWSGSNQCLDLREGNPMPGAAAQMWQCLAPPRNSNQRWTIK